MPAYPISLPQSWLSGALTVTPQPMAATFEPEVGAPMSRRRSTAELATYSGRVSGTQTQAVEMMRFYQRTCAGGSLSFTNPDGFTGELATFRFRSPPVIAHNAANVYFIDLDLLRIA
jgi:hypothetical protein